MLQPKVKNNKTIGVAKYTDDKKLMIYTLERGVLTRCI